MTASCFKLCYKYLLFFFLRQLRKHQLTVLDALQKETLTNIDGTAIYSAAINAFEQNVENTH